MVSEAPARRPRSKRSLIIALLLGAGVLLLASTQEWARFSLAEGAATVEEITVTGQQMLAGAMPISIALIAVAVTLAISGRVLRIALAVATILLGGGLGVVCVQRVFDSQAGLIASASAQLAEVTGFGDAEHAGIVSEAHLTVWPAVAAAAGLAVAVLGVVVLFVGRRWSTGGRRYDTRPSEEREQGDGDRISDWDAISDGDDPTG